MWDDGSVVVTPATYDPETGEVTAESADVDPEGCLEREFITLKDEEEIEVCPDCHSYTMKTVVGDRADLSYGEMQVCRDSDCDSNQ